MKNLVFISRLVLGVVAAILLPCSGTEEPESDPQKQRESLARVEFMIERLKNAPPAEAMPKLGEILRKTERRSIYQVEERWQTHEKAKAAILALPGHADFFRSEFKRIKAEFRDKGDDNRYDQERVILFETMRQLPSPQIVPVLVELLDDNEDEPPPPRPYQDYADYSANNKMAAATLGKLIDEPFYDQAGAEAWKQWFAQLKEGGRGFRLKGSDVVHYLASPVTEKRRSAPKK